MTATVDVSPAVDAILAALIPLGAVGAASLLVLVLLRVFDWVSAMTDAKNAPTLQDHIDDNMW